MSKIVGKRGRFNDIWIYPAEAFRESLVIASQLFSQTPSDLCYLERVRQSVVKYVTFKRADDLRDTSQSSEG
jgi:hypothetical protein